MEQTSERAMDGPATVGARLRAAREARGQSLEEIGRQTRVPVRHLVQIEDGRLEGLPAAPYSAGFVKAYARAVDLDPVALSQEFRAELAEAAHVAPRLAYEPYEPADPVRLPPRLLAIVAAAIALLLLVGYGIMRSGMLTGEGPETRAQLAAHGETTPEIATTETQQGEPLLQPAAPSPTPATTPAQAPVLASAPTPAPVGGAVQLAAIQDTWLKISERNGPTLFMGILHKGQTYDVPATAADPVVRTGRPEGLAVTVGGRAVASLGRPARTISNVSLKAGALLTRGNAPAGSAPAAGAQGVPSAFLGTSSNPRP
jgi:cytoskeletal protein RodZ